MEIHWDIANNYSNPTGNNTLYCLTLSEECGSPEVTECLTVTFPDPIIPQINPDVPVQCLPGDFIFYNNSVNGWKFSPPNSSFQVV